VREEASYKPTDQRIHWTETLAFSCLANANLMAKTETLNLRVSAEFKRRLAEEAAKEKRSVTNYLEVVLTEFWNRGDSKTSLRSERQIRSS
jgi:hypothetical protein